MQVDEGVVLYRNDGERLPYGAQEDETVARFLAGDTGDYGILDPHISSVTGVNVFNLFIRLNLADGTAAYLVKEYEVDSIVDSFSLSFYQNAGFSYVVDSDGNVLIRPPHPNSNKTVQNLFDILEESPNDPSKLQLFVDSLSTEKTGWATFSYQGEETVFCYLCLLYTSVGGVCEVSVHSGQQSSYGAGLRYCAGGICGKLPGGPYGADSEKGGGAEHVL